MFPAGRVRFSTSPWAIAASLFLLTFSTGCRSVQHRPSPAGPDACFEKVGVIDFRSDDMDDFRDLVRPGDLIVNYMRTGRAAKMQQWLFCILPHGHAMIVLDPSAPDGLLECRFHGSRRGGPEELKLYSYNTVYRLKEPERVNLSRLNEFAAVACEQCGKYNFASWVGRNDEMTPDRPEEISRQYTCSTMVAAAYHYAGITLRESENAKSVVTPINLVDSAGSWNQHANVDEPLYDPSKTVQRHCLATD